MILALRLSPKNDSRSFAKAAVQGRKLHSGTSNQINTTERSFLFYICHSNLSSSMVGWACLWCRNDHHGHDSSQIFLLFDLASTVLLA